MGRILDVEEVDAALKRAAHRAIYGTREERSGRFRPVRSSTMTSIRYHHDACELEVTFTSGKAYRYLNVPLRVYVDLLDAGAKVEFFNANIRDKFTHRGVAIKPRRG
jgi:hypothetical protein